MRRILTVSTLIAAIVLLAGIANAGEGNTMSTDEAKVLATIERMTSAFHKGDIEGVMASYEDNATVVFVPQAPVSDASARRERFQNSFRINPKFAYSGHEVYVVDDIAIHFAPWTMQGKSPDGVTIKRSGLSVAVLRRQKDGRWLMVIDNPHGQNLLGK